MSLTLTQAEIDALANDGALREEDGRRIHKMSPINRAKVIEVIGTIAKVDAAPIEEEKKEDRSEELGRAMHLVISAIKDSQASESEARNLIQDVLNAALKSNEETLCALKDALVQKSAPKVWVFDIVRNTAGMMTSIRATEET